jgi:hypothetical protein
MNAFMELVVLIRGEVVEIPEPRVILVWALIQAAAEVVLVVGLVKV